MKKLFIGLLMLMIVSFVAGESVLAQKPKPRDLYIEKEKNEDNGKSGAKVRILLKRGNEKERYVTPNETFYAGDKIKLAFNINFSGYVALLNLGSSGRITMLYPYVGTSSRVELSSREQLIPGNEKDWIKFDNQAGREQISIIFSTNPIQSVQQVIEMSGQSQTSTTTLSANANATVNVNSSGNGSTIYVATSVEAQAILQELNSRSLKRAKSRDLYIETVNDDATYCVAESGLISEPTAFLVTLKHR